MNEKEQSADTGSMFIQQDRMESVLVPNLSRPVRFQFYTVLSLALAGCAGSRDVLGELLQKAAKLYRDEAEDAAAETHTLAFVGSLIDVIFRSIEANPGSEIEKIVASVIIKRIGVSLPVQEHFAFMCLLRNPSPEMWKTVLDMIVKNN